MAAATRDKVLKAAKELNYTASRSAAALASGRTNRIAMLARERLAGYGEAMAIDASSRRSIDRLFLVRDIVTTQYVYLTAMADYLAHGGHSRGSVLYTDPAGALPVWFDAAGAPIDLGLDEQFRFVRDEGGLDDVAQIVTVSGGEQPLPQIDFGWRAVRPLPSTDEPFEVVWRDYLVDRNVH